MYVAVFKMIKSEPRRHASAERLLFTVIKATIIRSLDLNPLIRTSEKLRFSPSAHKILVDLL